MQLASRGIARLILVDLDGTDLAAARAALDGPTIITLTGDASDEKLWAKAAPFLEGLDFALANAGVAGNGDIPTHDFAEWRRIMAVNLDGVFLTLRAAMSAMRSEEHTSELQSLMRISYAVFCLKKKIQITTQTNKPT